MAGCIAILFSVKSHWRSNFGNSRKDNIWECVCGGTVFQLMMEVFHFKRATATQHFLPGFEIRDLAGTHSPDFVILSQTQERNVQETQLPFPKGSLCIWVTAIFHFKINTSRIFEVTANFLQILYQAFSDVLASGKSPHGKKRYYREEKNNTLKMKQVEQQKNKSVILLSLERIKTLSQISNPLHFLERISRLKQSILIFT